jgi:hypothetical protein
MFCRSPSSLQLVICLLQLFRLSLSANFPPYSSLSHVHRFLPISARLVLRRRAFIANHKATLAQRLMITRTTIIFHWQFTPTQPFGFVIKQWRFLLLSRLMNGICMICAPPSPDRINSCIFIFTTPTKA